MLPAWQRACRCCDEAAGAAAATGAPGPRVWPPPRCTEPRPGSREPRTASREPRAASREQPVAPARREARGRRAV